MSATPPQGWLYNTMVPCFSDRGFGIYFPQLGEFPLGIAIQHRKQEHLPNSSIKRDYGFKRSDSLCTRNGGIVGNTFSFGSGDSKLIPNFSYSFVDLYLDRDNVK